MNALDRERIYAAGQDKGRAAGSWVVDGNTSAEWARSVLVMLDEGDPAIDGYITEPSPLSRWHARVAVAHQHPDRETGCAVVAREAIVAELAQREGPNFDPSVVGVRMEAQDLRPGVEAYQYIETNTHDVD